MSNYFNCDYDELDREEIEAFTGEPRIKAVYTITLGELVIEEIFDWSNELLDWSDAAYDSDQYNRVCSYFIERFYYHEISMLPIRKWFRFLHRKLVYELMPKYRFLYAEAERNVKMTSAGGESLVIDNDSSSSVDDYYKKRSIDSAYPETLLSSNSDYITSGNDTEDERTKSLSGSIDETRTTTRTAAAKEYMENVNSYLETLAQIDKRLLDELEIMFVSLYTANYNGF